MIGAYTAGHVLAANVGLAHIVELGSSAGVVYQYRCVAGEDRVRAGQCVIGPPASLAGRSRI